MAIFAEVTENECIIETQGHISYCAILGLRSYNIYLLNIIFTFNCNSDLLGYNFL